MSGTGLPPTTVPPLPANFVPREEELNSLVKALLKHQGKESRQAITLISVEGMGGIGKTVLAQAVCNDQRVKVAFPDGIIWQSMSRESAYEITARLRAVCRALNDISEFNSSQLRAAGNNIGDSNVLNEDSEFNSSNEVDELDEVDRYRLAMNGKKALLVIDDASCVKDIEPWLASAPHSRVLFTTRNREIAAAAGADNHSVEFLSEREARRVFARWVGKKREQLPPISSEIIQECHGLVLALAMVGAMLRGKPPQVWEQTLKLLRNADLTKIKIQFPGYRYPNLFVAIQASVNALEPLDQERYGTLAVMVENMSAARVIQQALWGTESDQAADMAERLISLSLAQRDTDGQSIRLHALQLDFVRAQYPNQEALGLIHGAINLSWHVIAQDPSQFASQIVGRLLGHESQPAVRHFIEDLSNGAPVPWLRPTWPALGALGTVPPRTLVGHLCAVHGVVVSWDGRRAVSASADNTLKVFDLASGRELLTLEGHIGRVNGVAMSSDGRLVVSASDDQMLKVWDVESGRELLTLMGHSHVVAGVAVSRDGRRAVSASWDRTLKVWDVESGRDLHTLEGHSGPVNAVAVAGDGRWAISASRDHTLKVWDMENGRELRTLVGHSNSVIGVALSMDGRRAVSASWDNTLKVWDVESGREMDTLARDSDSGYGLALSTDGRRVMYASGEHTVKVRNVDNRSLIATFTCEASVLCCAFCDSRNVIVGDAAGRVYFLELVEHRKDSKRTQAVLWKDNLVIRAERAMREKKKHVFLSYCRDNQADVSRLRDDLIAAGETVWWDKDDLLPGQNWELAIDEAVESAYAVILCLSKESEGRTSSGIYPEASAAINAYLKYPHDKIFLIPVRLSDCKIPTIKIDSTRKLKDLQTLNLFPEGQRAEGIKKLLKAIEATPHHP